MSTDMILASAATPVARTFSQSLGDFSERVKQRIAEVRRLFNEEREKQFEIADAILGLVEDCGCKLSFLAEHLDRSESTLSSYIQTAREYGKDTRQPGVAFFRHQQVAVAARRVEQRVKRTTGKEFRFDRRAALTLVVEHKAKKNEKIVTILRNEARKLALPVPDLTPLALVGGGGVLNTAHHGDYRDVLTDLAGKIPPVDLVHLDPPYCGYKHGPGSGASPAAAGLSNCDNDTEESAVQVTCDAFALAEKMLAKNGAVLLWQPANALRHRIGKAIEDAGLVPDMCVVWNKSRGQPGYPESPFTQHCEFAYLLHRKGEHASNHDGSDRKNIITFAPVHFDRADMEDRHAYQKPYSLCEFLIRKLTPEGGVVADLFGCSGEFCCAAHQLGRQWIYCESNASNFEFGVRRIADATRRAEVA